MQRKYPSFIDGKDLWDRDVFSEYYKKYQITKDPKLRDRLITAHLSYVDRVAWKFRNNGLDYEDLQSEGRMGLMVALDHFNPDFTGRNGENIGFTTYAGWWIRQFMQRAIGNQRRSIRIPLNQLSKANELNKYKEDYMEKHNREPTVKEMAEYIGKSPRQIVQYFEYLDPIISIDYISKDDNEEERGVRAISPNSEFEFDNVLERINLEVILGKVKLDKRERGMLYKRFGFNGFPEMTLEELGNEYGVSREGVRQIIGRTLTKIRSKIRDNLEDRIDA